MRRTRLVPHDVLTAREEMLTNPLFHYFVEELHACDERMKELEEKLKTKTADYQDLSVAHGTALFELDQQEADNDLLQAELTRVNRLNRSLMEQLAEERAFIRGSYRNLTPHYGPHRRLPSRLLRVLATPTSEEDSQTESDLHLALAQDTPSP